MATMLLSLPLPPWEDSLVLGIFLYFLFYSSLIFVSILAIIFMVTTIIMVIGCMFQEIRYLGRGTDEE